MCESINRMRLYLCLFVCMNVFLSALSCSFCLSICLSINVLSHPRTGIEEAQVVTEEAHPQILDSLNVFGKGGWVVVFSCVVLLCCLVLPCLALPCLVLSWRTSSSQFLCMVPLFSVHPFIVPFRPAHPMTSKYSRRCRLQLRRQRRWEFRRVSVLVLSFPSFDIWFTSCHSCSSFPTLWNIKRRIHKAIKGGLLPWTPGCDVARTWTLRSHPLPSFPPPSWNQLQLAMAIIKTYVAKNWYPSSSIPFPSFITSYPLFSSRPTTQKMMIQMHRIKKSSFPPSGMKFTAGIPSFLLVVLPSRHKTLSHHPP